MQFISSPQNQQFKNLKGLQQKKQRQKQGRFILEGRRFVVDAIDHKWHCDGVFFEEMTWEMLDEIEKDRFEAMTCVYVLEMSLFEKISETEHAQGIVGVFEMPDHTFDHHIFDQEAFEGRFVVYLDRIQDPGNLGTILRTADAAGVDLVMLNKGCVDIYNDKVLRSTAGSILNVKIVTGLEDEETFKILKDMGFKIIVTDLESDFDYNDDRAYGSNNCLVIGNEGNGVSDVVKSAADVKVKIPIFGKAESLNASVAAGIMIYKIRTNS